LYYSTDGQADLSERLIKMFTNTRSKKNLSKQENEDHKFYEQMLKLAPVGDELKIKLSGVAHKLYTQL
jgi:hypothetical protein